MTGTTGEARRGGGGRAARIVGVILLLAGATGALWYSLDRTTQAPVPRERTGADFIVTWKCDQGHAIDAPGATGARQCATCGGEMYATLTCSCSNETCGKTAVMQLRYDAQVLPAEMRWRPAGEWKKYDFPPRCPGCGKAMRPG